MRHGVDAVLTGIGTVLADDPMLTDRTGLARRRRLLRVVLDSELRTPLDAKLVQSRNEDVLIFCKAPAMAERVDVLEALGVQVAGVGGEAGRLDLGAVLNELGQRKILSMLLECGAALNGAFLTAGLVDKVVLFYAQRELGAGAVPFAEGTGSPYLLEQRLKQVTRRKFGPDA